MPTQKRLSDVQAHSGRGAQGGLAVWRAPASPPSCRAAVPLPLGTPVLAHPQLQHAAAANPGRHKAVSPDQLPERQQGGRAGLNAPIAPLPSLSLEMVLRTASLNLLICKWGTVCKAHHVVPGNTACYSGSKKCNGRVPPGAGRGGASLELQESRGRGPAVGQGRCSL